MNKLELMLVCGIIIISAPYLGVYLSHKLSIKRIKEKLSKPTIDLDEGNEETGQKFMGREYDRIRWITQQIQHHDGSRIYPLQHHGGSRLYPQNNIQIPIEKKEDFIPKKKMKHHTLEEPIEYYSEDAVEDEGCGCANVCDNCYDTTDYEYPF
tara:strand:+ start:684 stop:1142 length:459 start_codon:yes stop_codon:yes gene_type:complete